MTEAKIMLTFSEFNPKCLSVRIISTCKRAQGELHWKRIFTNCSMKENYLTKKI